MGSNPLEPANTGEFMIERESPFEIFQVAMTILFVIGLVTLPATIGVL